MKALKLNLMEKSRLSEKDMQHNEPHVIEFTTDANPLR